MHEAHTHPVNDHGRGEAANFPEQLDVALGAPRLPRKNRKVGFDREIGELAQQFFLASGRKHLEMAETGERRRDPADNGARFGSRMPVVENVADHLVAGEREAQGAGGRNAQVMHRLAAEELPDRRAQHRQPIGGAGVGRKARTLELQRPVLAPAVDRFSEIDGAPVAELSRPVAELVPAVTGGVRVHAGQNAVPGENLQKLVGRALLRTQPDQFGNFPGVSDETWGRRGPGRHAGVAGIADLPDGVPGLRIRGQGIDEAIVESQWFQGGSDCLQGAAAVVADSRTSMERDDSEGHCGSK